MTRTFGQHLIAELEEARFIAASQLETYGDFTAEQWKHYRTVGIWNDHVAVQAALKVIMDRNDRRPAYARKIKIDALDELIDSLTEVGGEITLAAIQNYRDAIAQGEA